MSVFDDLDAPDAAAVPLWRDVVGIYLFDERGRVTHIRLKAGDDPAMPPQAIVVPQPDGLPGSG